MIPMAAIDEALEIFSGFGPEFGTGLSNHGPMGAEALCALGRDAEVPTWSSRYRKRLSDRPPAVARIDETNWHEALGDITRATDWEAFMAEQLDQMRWQDALVRWVPRLAPGLMAGATHGVIRTAHAVRSLAADETPARRAEFITGIAYWAARYQLLPGVPGPATAAMPSSIIDSLPIMPPRERSRRPSSIFTAVAELDAFPPFAAAIDMAAPGDDLSAFLSDLTQTMAALYLPNAGPASISYVHTVTAPSALRMLAPHLPNETALLAARYTWQACAAIHSRGHYPHDFTMPEEPPDRDDLVDRAVQSGDEHAIKFTEACLREYDLVPNPVFLAAPLDLSARYGRKAE